MAKIASSRLFTSHYFISMRVKASFRQLLHFSLLILALVFCRRNLVDYLEEKTYYVVTKEPLTPKDLPTLTLCLPPSSIVYPPESNTSTYILGQNMNIKARVLEKSDNNIVLMEDTSVQALHGLELSTVVVQQIEHLS